MLMLRLIKFLIIVILCSCASTQNCTSISCTAVEVKEKKQSFFSSTPMQKRHKKPKQGVFKKGVLPKMSNPKK